MKLSRPQTSPDEAARREAALAYVHGMTGAATALVVVALAAMLTRHFYISIACGFFAVEAMRLDGDLLPWKPGKN